MLAAILLNGCSIYNNNKNANPNMKDAQVGQSGGEVFATFEPDTLYDLMVAELGGHRQRYDLALGNYLKQAHRTRDVGVTKRAYHIASLVAARQAALDASILWSELAPNDVEALKANTFELMQAGKYKQAVNKMNQVLLLDNHVDLEPMATYAVGMPEGDRAALFSAFSKASSQYSSNDSLSIVLAMLLHQSSRNDEALALCDRLIKKDPDNIRPLIIKGRIFKNMGRNEEAERMLAQSVKRYPDKNQLRLLYGRILIQMDKLDLAEEQFEALFQQSPADVEVLLSLGLIAVERGKVDEAKGYFEALLSFNLRPNVANFYLGKINETKSNWQKARQYYAAVTPGKEFMLAQIAMAQMLIKQGHWTEARKQMAQARTSSPADAEQLYLLEGEYLTTKGENDQALALYNQALLHDPKALSLLYARAMLLEKLGQISKMEVDLKAILTEQPNNATALNALGYTLADHTTRFKEAMELVTKAYKLNSDEPVIMDSLGWVHYKLGNLNEALKFLQMAYEKLPDPEVAAHLGEVLWKLGKKEQARSLWTTALKSKPDSKVLLECIKRLDKEMLSNSQAVTPNSKVK